MDKHTRRYLRHAFLWHHFGGILGLLALALNIWNTFVTYGTPWFWLTVALLIVNVWSLHSWADDYQFIESLRNER